MENLSPTHHHYAGRFGADIVTTLCAKPPHSLCTGWYSNGDEGETTPHVKSPSHGLLWYEILQIYKQLRGRVNGRENKPP